LEEKWEVWKMNLKDERMKEGESGAGIRVQRRMDEDEDEEIDEGRGGPEGGHDGEERMQFQEDRVGEIVAISEMEADEEVGFLRGRERQMNATGKDRKVKKTVPEND
jgi:hypothetical protein